MFRDGGGNMSAIDDYREMEAELERIKQEREHLKAEVEHLYTACTSRIIPMQSRSISRNDLAEEYKNFSKD